jgi:hypothetical protein
MPSLLQRRSRLWWATGVVALAVAVGGFGVGTALRPAIALFAAVFALLAFIPVVATVTGRLIGAVLVGLFALVGFNVVSDQLARLVGHRLPILAGLVVAVAVFAAAAAVYLGHTGWRRDVVAGTALALALFLIVAVPVLVERSQAGAGTVPVEERVKSQVDVMIVGDGRVHGPLPPVAADPALRAFDVRYSVGYADGDQVRWTLVGSSDAEAAQHAAAQGREAAAVSARPAVREDADPVLVLLVDGTDPVVTAPEALRDVRSERGEVARWRRIAAAAAPRAVPKFALLQTTRRARLLRWTGFAPHGDVVSLQGLRRTSVTDAGVALAIGAPTSEADFALALVYRPILLFDTHEPVPLPLSVGWLFGDGHVRLCHDRRIAGTDCGDPVRDPGRLVNGATHLQLDVPSGHELRRIARDEARDAAQRAATVDVAAEGAPPLGTPLAPAEADADGPGTAIYVHPVPVERDGRRLLYLDYWWYLPDNPAEVGGGAFCGAGLVIPGITCHDHQSDWEGLTVVVDRTARKPVVRSVQYAEHNSVVSYGWSQLRARWDTDPRLEPFVSAVSDGTQRPLAFVAKGTHATYALPCPRDCHQVAQRTLGENPSRGTLPWIGNDTATCGRMSCLQLLPTRVGGREPALWNAFKGAWGERHCALTYYCDSASPPAAPGTQVRYQHPTHCDGDVDWQWRFRGRPCDM